MQTSPVIIPCTAPMTEGLPKKMTSRQVQVRRLVAALTLVLSTATVAVTLGAYGAPPLNPAQPNHSSPPPAIMSRMLFGENRSLSLFSLGPTLGGGEAGDAGGEVDDVSAGVVDDAPLVEEAAAPEAERADGVGEEEPERGERHPRLDVHPPQERPGEQHQRDGRELELEQHQRRLRVERLGARRLERAVAAVVRRRREHRALHQEVLRQRRPGLGPEREQPVAERHAEADEHPHDKRGRVGVQRHEGGVDGPLLLHDAAVDHHQPRHRLDADERRRHQLPRGVALVQPRRHRRQVRHVRPGLRRRRHP
ncbi:Os01g0831950 [Oryza sativa Japonica Group]|uniref:Os01g0831950 protein n=1 Tax=Oryza sativa subsp. japonica TaxID=39947 RepID=A0A0P0VA14_ORYSJ|nr:hypothetical protein EE612_006633 [Oryza sativa]BAS75062.1 Os01g0831950 [Oryza sativa Japonica Group]